MKTLFLNHITSPEKWSTYFRTRHDESATLTRQNLNQTDNSNFDQRTDI
ncbi:MAG: hypothetical protein JST21_02075 [Bacteroidetes bacterium]|nr:hypothetical protein [Bacteroidota bacterium]